MTLTESDFLNWYNKEIDRYRDHEWQLLAFNLGFTSAIFLFLSNKETYIYIPLFLFTFIFIAITIIFVYLEIHTHNRLNDFRFKRDQLLKPYHYTYNLPKNNNRIKDNLFYCGFLGVHLTWDAIIYILILNNCLKLFP